MIKIAIPGVNGRMGQAVAKEVLQASDLDLVIATVRDVAQIGQKVVNSNVIISDKILHADFDVLIDFTLPDGVMQHLAYCRANKKAMVIGATGFSEAQLDQIKAASKEIAIVMSANMSIGVNICFKLLAQASQMLDQGWQTSILDLHHQHKKDAPSGTAKQMANILTENSSKDLTEIEIVSERHGDIVGTHIVTFKTPTEFVTIAHEAQDRSIFAQGAVAAARWAFDKPAGLYSMLDVIVVRQVA